MSPRVNELQGSGRTSALPSKAQLERPENYTSAEVASAGAKPTKRCQIGSLPTPARLGKEAFRSAFAKPESHERGREEPGWGLHFRRGKAAYESVLSQSEGGEPLRTALPSQPRGHVRREAALPGLPLRHFRGRKSWRERESPPAAAHSPPSLSPEGEKAAAAA